MSERIPSAGPGPLEQQPPALLSESEHSWLTWLRCWARDVAVAVFIAGIIILFFYQPVKVEGTSMMPRLTDQERIFINKFVYRVEEIQRGDVVVFRYPGDPSKSYIKRVIGLPGDTVEMRRGEVYINGQRLEEPYLLPEFRGSQTGGPWRVGAESYFVLGDHRTSSNDSRVWGNVSRRHIFGKAQWIYWPVDRWGLLE
ncbi:MAG TPA: signal peptidase I [Terriglobia bacterium]|nr:signal peptidase I [Terriglobia bacterium]